MGLFTNITIKHTVNYTTEWQEDDFANIRDFIDEYYSDDMAPLIDEAKILKELSSTKGLKIGDYKYKLVASKSGDYKPNVKAILDVADSLANEKKITKECSLSFNMTLYADAIEDDDNGNWCGTAACIAGWAVSLYDKNGKRKKTLDPHVPLALENNGDGKDVFAVARDIFKVPNRVAYELFSPQHIDYDKVTSKMAAKVLQKYVQTGEVEWPKSVYIN